MSYPTTDGPKTEEPQSEAENKDVGESESPPPALPGDRVLAAYAAGQDADPRVAAEIWRELLAGRWSIVDHCDRDGRRYLLAVENPPKEADSKSLTAREVQILSRVALRHSLKLVSYELGLSHSTVSGQLQSALRKLRLSSVAEAVRLLGGSGPTPTV
jgi:DNA-binding NarL/FixJ family response regulator